MPKITECPICGAGIECHRIVFYVDTVIDQTGKVIISGFPRNEDEDCTVYCHNDHNLEQMLQALKEKQDAES